MVDPRAPQPNGAVAATIAALDRRLDDKICAVAKQLEALDRLTEAKFITHKTLLEGQAAQVALALTASEKAIGKAEAANEKRFDSVNEFRAQLADQAATFMRADVADARFAAVENKTDQQDTRLDLLHGKGAGIGQAWQVLIVVAGIALTILLYYLSHK